MINNKIIKIWCSYLKIDTDSDRKQGIKMALCYYTGSNQIQAVDRKNENLFGVASTMLSLVI